MTDKRAFNANLNARGLEREVSEEQARRMCATQGQSSLFLIDAHHGKLVTDEDGDAPAEDVGECAYPGCVLPVAHDGDHDYGDEPSNVVSFSS